MKTLESKKRAVAKMKELSKDEKKKWIAYLENSYRETNRLKKEFGKFYREINKIVFNFDPIGITIEDHRDEYQSEAEEILRKIEKIASSERLKKDVKSIFVKNFHRKDVENRINIIDDMSEEIWKEWVKYRDSKKTKSGS